ncbi:DUF5133 domain-containing protein [Streptomyces sp. NBC_01142]|uniref:DUF5133 domain-containing protein n=1 Tax=Streptomyces sp. NBC_01142 TaxID=2975865 RepID=UPI00225231B5|nr:DUF5133 domain-containing protein [Streptomyces sp. NBC_01142]MCX4825926.1 DUF5133 domain-containing protein [Streptomyces sp. NBC_01142]
MLLLPDRNEVIRLLARYRAQERLVLAYPGDPEAWNNLESTTYTLCVLMGERTASAAVLAAERYTARPRLRRLSL